MLKSLGTIALSQKQGRLPNYGDGTDIHYLSRTFSWLSIRSFFDHFIKSHVVDDHSCELPGDAASWFVVETECEDAAKPGFICSYCRTRYLPAEGGQSGNIASPDYASRYKDFRHLR